MKSVQGPYSDEIEHVVAITVVFFVCITGFFIFFILMYSRRQRKNREEKLNLQAQYRQEVLKTQIEVQDQTLQYISREIHDNITQVLSFVKLSLGVNKVEEPEKYKVKIDECRELLARAINDLRDLSKSMSFESIKSAGLINTIKLEIDRINGSGLITISLDIEGEPYPLGEKRELVLFRIFQETVNNALKHANAKHLKVSLLYSEKLFNLTLADDGDGFYTGILDEHRGSGLKNILNRANLIGAKGSIDSSPGNGCVTTITLNEVIQQIYADGNPDSIS